MYSPRLVIGVSHVEKNIPFVESILEKEITNGMVIGTEAYSHPLDHIEDHWNFFGKSGREFVKFYNSIGDFIKFKGGVYLPLQSFEDYDNSCKEIKDNKFISDFEQYQQKMREALNNAGILEAISEWDYMFNEDSVNFARSMDRLLCRLYLKYGFDKHESRDNHLIELSRKYEPEIVVIGWNHVPALLVEYPKTAIKIVS